MTQGVPPLEEVLQQDFEQQEDKDLWDHLVNRHDGFLYRYEERRYVDQPIEIELRKLRVLKQTAKGIWIQDWYHKKGKRFVLFNSRKKYACLTEEEALESFKARKSRQVKILRKQLNCAEVALSIAKGETPNGQAFALPPVCFREEET